MSNKTCHFAVVATAAILILLVICGTAAKGAAAAPITQQQITVAFPSDTLPSFSHFWKECFGSGHALLATRRDYHTQLRQLQEDIGVKRVRMHGVFDDDMSVVLVNQQGQRFYSFYNVDQIYDGLLELGVRPIVELSFMPGQFAKCSPWVPSGKPCQTVMHYQGVITMPANFSEWEDLVVKFSQHLVDRYGIEEVSTWNFEVWNEMWGVTDLSVYMQLYNASYRGLKSTSSRLRVGGPTTMQLLEIGSFVNAAQGRFEFVSSHLYPTDPVPAASKQLDAFSAAIKAARSKIPANTPFYITEYNAGLFEPWLLYSSYAAAFLFRNIPLLHGVVDIFSYWTFSDIFEESGMHSSPFPPNSGYHYGIRSSVGIKKPIYRAFELLRDAGSVLVPITEQSTPFGKSFVNAFVTMRNYSDPSESNERLMSIFVSNFAPKPQGFSCGPASLTVQLQPAEGLSCSESYAANITIRTISNTSGNAHAAWLRQGSPEYPTKMEVDAINRATEIAWVSGTLDTNSCEVKVPVLEPYSATRIDVEVFLPMMQMRMNKQKGHVKHFFINN